MDLKNYVGSDGAIYGGAGKVKLDSNGLTINGQLLTFLNPSNYVSTIYEDNTGNLVLGTAYNLVLDGHTNALYGFVSGSVFVSGSGHQILASMTEPSIFPDTTGTCYLGKGTNYFSAVFANSYPCFVHDFPMGKSVLEGIKGIKANKEGKWLGESIPDEGSCLVELEGKTIKSPDLPKMVALLTRGLQQVIGRLEELENATNRNYA
jgi:hypothetical protein